MNVKTFVVISLFTLLLVTSVNAVIPSEQAISSTSLYLRQGEQASIINRPYIVEQQPYFVVYFHPQTDPKGKNLIIVIKAESGELVTDRGILQKVYEFDSKLAFLQDFVREKTLSFQEVKSAIESGKTLREGAETHLDNVETELADLDENIATVQTVYSLLILNVERLNDEIESGTEMQELFETEYSSQALEALINRYNSTLKTLVETVKSGADYQNAVINKSNELTQKRIDQNLFKPDLQAAYDVGLDKFSSLTSLKSALNEFSTIASEQTFLQINDSIDSYLYRKEKVESDSAIENVRPSVEELQGRKSEIEECTSITVLERRWRDALNAQEKNNFAQVNGNVTLVQSELSKISGELDACSGAVTTQTNREESNKYDLYLAAVFVLLIAYFAWKFYSKQKNKIEEEPNELQGKGNLFG